MKMLQNALLIISAFMLINGNLSAQNNRSQTLIKSASWNTIGFFAASNIAVSKIDKADAAMLNSRTGVVFNDRFSLGGFYNFTINNLVPKSESVTDVYLDYKSVGAFLEYTIFSSRVVHATFPILVGGGRVELDSEGHDPDLGQATFMFVEPGVLCEVNVHRFVRLNFGASYRSVGKMSYRTLDQAKLSGLSAQLGLKLGLFKR